MERASARHVRGSPVGSTLITAVIHARGGGEWVFTEGRNKGSLPRPACIKKKLKKRVRHPQSGAMRAPPVRVGFASVPNATWRAWIAAANEHVREMLCGPRPSRAAARVRATDGSAP